MLTLNVFTKIFGFRKKYGVVIAPLLENVEPLGRLIGILL
jgi:hypothetical protein